LGGRTFTQISSGADHTCAIDSSNDLYCWGSNSSGQLGMNSSGAGTDQNTPTHEVSGNKFTQVAAGSSATCAIGTDRKLYCSGANTWGKLGTGSTGNQKVLTLTDSGTEYLKIYSAGSASFCGLTATKQIKCWGSPFYTNQYSQVSQDQVSGHWGEGRILGTPLPIW